jgi:hypothetical protein
MTIGNVEHQDDQAGQLISGVLSDARDLAVAEVDKLKAEAITKAKDVGDDLKLAAIALLILTVAAILLGVALALALVALGVPGWVAFGVIAVACAITGIVFLKRYVLEDASEAVHDVKQTAKEVAGDIRDVTH